MNLGPFHYKKKRICVISQNMIHLGGSNLIKIQLLLTSGKRNNNALLRGQFTNEMVNSKKQIITWFIAMSQCGFCSENHLNNAE